MNSKRIVYKNDDGDVFVVIPAVGCGLTAEQIANKDVPSGVQYQILDASQIPSDRLFRGAWRLSSDGVFEEIATSKIIAHEIRRSFRAKEFEPLDIQATIPSLSVAAETARELIREKYAAMQAAIDNSSSVSEIKAALTAQGV